MQNQVILTKLFNFYNFPVPFKKSRAYSSALHYMFSPISKLVQFTLSFTILNVHKHKKCLSKFMWLFSAIEYSLEPFFLRNNTMILFHNLLLYLGFHFFFYIHNSFKQQCYQVSLLDCYIDILGFCKVDGPAWIQLHLSICQSHSYLQFS